MKKVYVLIGNYGSGKTELALNFAINAAAEGGRTELLDLDMVNTYFRLTEHGKMTEMKEIRLVSPNYACSGIETLSLPAEVASAFDMDWDTVVLMSAATLWVPLRLAAIIRTLLTSSQARLKC